MYHVSCIMENFYGYDKSVCALCKKKNIKMKNTKKTNESELGEESTKVMRRLGYKKEIPEIQINNDTDMNVKEINNIYIYIYIY